MKPFKWRKQGLIFGVDSRWSWMNSHAQVPFSIVFNDFVRVYFSTREAPDGNMQYKSYSGFVDLDRHNLSRILNISSQPIIELGHLGEFDEFGSMAGSVVSVGDRYRLYYCGWQRKVSVPYEWAIGIAESSDGVSFARMGSGPLFGSTISEPFLQACPIVYKLGESDWHMFYLSGVKWFCDGDGKTESQYLLMHATSQDGLLWARDGIPILPVNVEDECQTSCSLIFREGQFHMFFSYRYGSNFRENSLRGYRIGYAVSDDLVSWSRDDSLAGLSVSPTGWDSEMVAYPHVTEIEGKTIMFYCGNQFGKAGFGYAVLE
jgi:predicted GH43/DUF377 family glycosyl hydrolase